MQAPASERGRTVAASNVDSPHEVMLDAPAGVVVLPQPYARPIQPTQPHRTHAIAPFDRFVAVPRMGLTISEVRALAAFHASIHDQCEPERTSAGCCTSPRRTTERSEVKGMRPLVYWTIIGLVAGAPLDVRAGDAGVATASGAHEPLRLSIDRSKVDLKQHRLEIVLSREAVKLTLEVTGDSGAVLTDEEVDLTGKPAGVPIPVTWSPASEEPAARIELRAADAFGYWATAWLLPWSVSIPHREVLFKTGSWRIEDAEKPKLEESFAQIADAVARHQELGTVVLFVAGHTDTVGRPADNFKLSRERARAIAGWFRDRGLRVPIAYEGFGESALLVKTGDEVDEPRNRRADYILAFEEPVIAAVGFRPAWQRLK